MDEALPGAHGKQIEHFEALGLHPQRICLI